MKIALAQVNPTVADLSDNVERCLAAIESAKRQGADLAVLPEMVIPGYPPRDILLDGSFIEAIQQATADLARRAEGMIPALVGSTVPVPPDEKPPYYPGLYNAALLLDQGEARLVAAKRLLPTYDVYHEKRWFVPGPPMPPVDIQGRRIGILICEDMWDQGYTVHPAAEFREAGAEALIAISASPYRQDVLPRRIHDAGRHGMPIIYVNMVGGQDELIFDGRSFALDESGKEITRLPAFEEVVQVVDFNAAAPPLPERAREPVEAELFMALTLGVRDFCRKNGLNRVFLGLSGGIDSAITAIIAAEALGPDHVTAVAIPSRYSDSRSTSCAQELAKNLGIGFEVTSLEAVHEAAEQTLAPLLDEEGTTAENIQARLRAMILMAYVNRHGGMLLNTSNKSELALGYSTLYGDMAGGLCPIADLTKPQVVQLARWIQAERGIFPQFILERPPSAELKADQVDPFDYDEVGPRMEALVQANQSNGPLRRSEHKRWQMGVILKVSEKAFGTGRLMPITRR
jgi:NAD+ synthetase